MTYPDAKTDTTFDIPESVEIVDEFQFDNAYIKSLSIPANCMFYALELSGLTSLESVSIAEENPYYKSIDGVVFSKDGRVMIAYPYAKSETEYHIPSGTLMLAPYSCRAKNLQVLYIPYSVVKADYMKYTAGENPFPKTIYYAGSEEEFDVIFGEFIRTGCVDECFCNGSTPKYQIMSLSSSPVSFSLGGIKHGGMGEYVYTNENHSLQSITVQVKNNDCDSTAVLYVGIYNRAGQMISCLGKNISVKKGETAKYTFDVNTQAFEIRAFILDGDNVPICNFDIDAADTPWIGMGG